MWRQGDVFIAQIAEIPAKVRHSPLPHGILVHGELTGHSHRLADPKAASLYSGDQQIGEMFLETPASGAQIIHEEHGTIVLPQGYYRVWRQREYTPAKIVVVRD
jgi:hypothetical protein